MRQGFEWVSGAGLVASYDSTERVSKTFCRTCGSGLVTFYRHREDIIGLPLGGVLGDIGQRPEFHIFVGSKASWHEVTDDLPAHDELPPDSSLLHALTE